jgi:protein-S-isoprenylcysteine O-methyltransferase Ste14
MKPEFVKDQGSRNDDFMERGGMWVVAQFALLAGWLFLGPLAGTLATSAWERGTAAVLLGIGAGVGISGARLLGANRTPFPKPLENARLIQHGIYAVVRHPLYLSLIALSFGWALLWRSGGAAVLAVVQALLLNAKAAREERWLRERFSEYAAYATRVKRLLPWIY